MLNSVGIDASTIGALVLLDAMHTYPKGAVVFVYPEGHDDVHPTPYSSTGFNSGQAGSQARVEEFPSHPKGHRSTQAGSLLVGSSHK